MATPHNAGQVADYRTQCEVRRLAHQRLVAQVIGPVNSPRGAGPQGIRAICERIATSAALETLAGSLAMDHRRAMMPAQRRLPGLTVGQRASFVAL